MVESPDNWMQRGVGDNCSSGIIVRRVVVLEQVVLACVLPLRSAISQQEKRMRSSLPLVLLTLVASLCLAASPQKPTKTKYLLTTAGGFVMSAEAGLAYSMAYEVREKLPAQVYVVAIFENPESPKEPLRKELEAPADATSIKVDSPGIHSIRNDALYKVSLSLYLDPDHKTRLVEHNDKVLFKMGKQMHGFVQQRYGVTIR